MNFYIYTPNISKAEKLVQAMHYLFNNTCHNFCAIYQAKNTKYSPSQYELGGGDVAAHGQQRKSYQQCLGGWQITHINARSS